jgi:hypothetical protein
MKKNILQNIVYNKQHLKVMQLIFFFGISAMLSACFKEEQALPRPPQGDTEIVQIPLTSNYDKQFYFDLFTNQIIASNNNESWDLAFDASDNGYHIWLNSSKLMQAWNTGRKDFQGVTSQVGAKWNWDYSDGDIAKNAIGEWGIFSNGNMVSNQHVFIIDRGVNKNENSLGRRKVIFESLQNGVYKVRFSRVDGGDEHVVEIPKDNRYNRVYLSLDNGGTVVKVEPEKNTYDLIFTRYTHIFLEYDTLPYLVTGVLLNDTNVKAVKDSVLKFDDITIDDISKFTFSSNKDAIGYDWKSFDISIEKYDIIAGKFYIVNDQEGNYYKLRFLDFFSDTGERGFPKFEYQRL